MSWITLTEDDVVSKLSGPETTALKSAALKSGQADPLAEVLGQVVREIRGRVGACSKNLLGPAGTIPDECEGAAINRIRFELATRLPVPGLLTDSRKEANAQAIQFLRDVAACAVAIVQPETPTTEAIGKTKATIVRSGSGLVRSDLRL